MTTQNDSIYCARKSMHVTTDMPRNRLSFKTSHAVWLTQQQPGHGEQIIIGNVNRFSFPQWTLLVAHTTQPLMNLICAVRPVRIGMRALDRASAPIIHHE